MVSTVQRVEQIQMSSDSDALLARGTDSGNSDASESSEDDEEDTRCSFCVFIGFLCCQTCKLQMSCCECYFQGVKAAAKLFWRSPTLGCVLFMVLEVVLFLLIFRLPAFMERKYGMTGLLWGFAFAIFLLCCGMPAFLCSIPMSALAESFIVARRKVGVLEERLESTHGIVVMLTEKVEELKEFVVEKQQAAHAGASSWIKDRITKFNEFDDQYLGDLFADADDPDGAVEWMYADAGTGMFADLNPFRWSGSMTLADCIQEMRALDNERPIWLKMPANFGKKFKCDTPKKAVEHLMSVQKFRNSRQARKECQEP